MKSFIKTSLVALLAISMVATSCRKNEELDSDLTSTEDNSNAEFQYDQVFKQVDGNATDIGLKKGGYPIVTIDTTTSPRTMEIDYGTINFLCNDGNYRRGKILVNWTGRYRDSATVIYIGFDNFYQNDNHIEGTKSVTNNGRNSQGQLSFTVAVNGKVTTPSNQTHTWISNRTRTWIDGENTKIWNDDKYQITGSTQGTNRKGNSYSATITSPLLVDLSCEWRLTAGVIEVTPQGKSARTIDYGNGACDRLVTVTIKGKSYTFARLK